MNDSFSRWKVFQEVYILKKIRHSNIIKLLEVFESEDEILIVMEYAWKGDLLQYIKEKGLLSESKSWAFFKQIVIALGHCHARSIIHRDIKLDNILVNEHNTVKICDFGVSWIMRDADPIRE